MDLLRLSSAIKTDSEAHRDDAQQEIARLRSLTASFAADPFQSGTDFNALLKFVSLASAHYKDIFDGLPVALIELLDAHAENLNADSRREVLRTLIVLSNQKVLPPGALLDLCFRLLRTNDRALRPVIRSQILADLARGRKRKQGRDIGTKVHRLLLQALKEGSESEGGEALHLIEIIFRRKIWDENKSVVALEEACFSRYRRVAVRALHVFLSRKLPRSPDVASHANGANKTTGEEAHWRQTRVHELTSLRRTLTSTFTKHTRGKMKRASRIQTRIQKLMNEEEEEDPDTMESGVGWPVVRALQNPDGFARRLLRAATVGSLGYDVRILHILLCCRVTGLHKLMRYELYSFVTKYIRPHQDRVTEILAAVAVSCHSLTDPDELKPLLRVIVDQFVNDRSRPEIIAVGLNAVREICVRSPLAMEEDMLGDLTLYSRSKQKAVAQAARSIIVLYRQVNPSLLRRKERGHMSREDAKRETKYGEEQILSRIPGARELEDELDSDDEAVPTLVARDDDLLAFGIDKGDGWEEEEEDEYDEEEEEEDEQEGGDDDDDSADASDASGSDAGESDDEGDHTRGSKRSLPIEARVLLTEAQLEAIKEARAEKRDFEDAFGGDSSEDLDDLTGSDIAVEAKRARSDNSSREPKEKREFRGKTAGGGKKRIAAHRKNILMTLHSKKAQQKKLAAYAPKKRIIGKKRKQQRGRGRVP
jgi:protein SDA1